MPGLAEATAGLGAVQQAAAGLAAGFSSQQGAAGVSRGFGTEGERGEKEEQGGGFHGWEVVGRVTSRAQRKPRAEVVLLALSEERRAWRMNAA
jgi:hypothetical protein